VSIEFFCPQITQIILHREEWRQFVYDHLLADAAEGAIDVAHAAVELGAIDTAVKIVSAFEEPDCSDCNG
jgi:hypothetical protein